MMPENNRPSPIFVGESAALDFLNSVAAPRTILLDWLETGAELLDWLVQAGLCVEAELQHLRTDEHAHNLQQALDDVREFRDEFRQFVSAISGTSEVPVASPMVERINQLLARGTQRLKIEATQELPYASTLATRSLALVSTHEFRAPSDLLPRIAAACAQLICKADFRHVRNCEGPTCTMYFVDVSKNHRRRWCTMEVCGNRAKAAAFRQVKSALKLDRGTD